MRSEPQWSLLTMWVTRSSTYLTGWPTIRDSQPAKAGTLCMKNFDPKEPPAATGTTLSLLAGILSVPAISHRKYVKFIELA